VCCGKRDRTHPSGGDFIPGLGLPPLEPFGFATRWLEIYSRDTEPFPYTALPIVWQTELQCKLQFERLQTALSHYWQRCPYTSHHCTAGPRYLSGLLEVTGSGVLAFIFVHSRGLVLNVVGLLGSREMVIALTIYMGER
jgi:hypothetical protein